MASVTKQECLHWGWDGTNVTCYHPTIEDLRGMGPTEDLAYEDMLRWWRWREEEKDAVYP